ncbi:protein of unknown function [Taphrina deformans PYCC 5710]|uniref:Uncharacterized protein n=1 Tax=Taphrina deformans (strain PYCC 5710 / ATCC 11124 / CBS 356.35 / IMI 108563 / JCM 9778 / NBRC 8474) TaxID=1097556 RepID=R4X9Q0_TAPDE|nr:protein of unknown function [Taphrina deformans PYCC 5710]|eukprot:CCG80964.1 protein of unknown function [Taphrina deformans PYCC 5710]
MKNSSSPFKEDKARWNLLVKTLINETAHLSSIPYESLSSGTVPEDDPEVILRECRHMVEDLTALYSHQKSHHKRETAAKDSRSSVNVPVVGAVARTPNIPLPPLVASLTKIDADLAAVDALVAGLTSGDSVKSHRSLLEQREILLAKRARVQRQRDAMGGAVKDLLSVGSVGEVYRVAQSVADSCPSVPDYARFLRNVLIHALILAIIEASFEEQRKGRVSLVVDKVLNLQALARKDHTASQAAEETRRVFGEVFEHPAITRLPLAQLLDKTTLTKYNNRLTIDAEVKVKDSKTTKISDASAIEHWILSQTWVTDEELMVDSFALQPRTATEENESRKDDKLDGTKADELASRMDESRSSNGDNIATDMADLERVESKKLYSRSNSSKSSSHEGSENLDRTKPDDYDFAFPSVPTNMVAHHESKLQTSEDAVEGIDEAEAQRLINLFASSPEASDDSRDEEPDYSEMVDLTPAEQEEVLKALASAREHHVEHSNDRLADGENVQELMKQAQAALKEFDLDDENKSDDKSDVVEHDRISDTDSVD